MRTVAGVDGVRDRWVAALLGDDGRVSWRSGLDAGGVVGLLTEVAVVGLDCPVGLVDGAHRAADVAARARAGSSVFPTPPAAALRAALAAADGSATLHPFRVVAQDAARAAGGTGIATQTWGLADKIVSVERALLAGPADAPDRLVEVHPECSFLAMTGGEPLGRKRSARGVARRAAALHAALGLGPDVLDDDALATVPVDDALDALAAAWSARRWGDGVAEVLGAEPAVAVTACDVALVARIVV